MPDKDNGVLGEDMIIDSESAVTLQDLEEMFDIELVKLEEQKRAERMVMSQVNAERIEEETKVIKEKAEELGDNIGKAFDDFGKTMDKARKGLGIDRSVLESDAGDAYKKLHYDCERGTDEITGLMQNRNREFNQERLKDYFAKMVLHNIVNKERQLRPETADGKQVAGPVERALNQPGAMKQFLEGIKNSDSFKDYFGESIGQKEIEKAFKENGPAKISRNLYSESRVFGVRPEEKNRDIGEKAITGFKLGLEENAAKQLEELKKPLQKEPDPRVLGSTYLRME